MGIIRRKASSSSSNYWITSENLCIWNTVCIDGKTILPAVQYYYLQPVYIPRLEYLKELQSKFHKGILFLDG
ncbi:MAG: hypothetical protein ACJ72C_10220 [Nitrososphaeraceae archaeon]